MPRRALATVVHKIVRLLTSLALFAAPTFAAATASATPYTLCASLLNSSHSFPKDPMRTLESACAGLDPSTDPSAITVTLSSTDFGTYSGMASASSDGFDKVKLFATVNLQDYKSGSYVEETPGGGIPFAASVFATYQDHVTVSGPSPLGVMQLTFGISGNLVWDGIAAQLCYGFAVGGPLQGGSCWTEQTLPSTITLKSEVFELNTPQEMNFQFSAVVFVADQGYPDLYSASATADLANTITLADMLVLAEDGQPIPGITVSSSGGFAYPLSPDNQVPAIPEPTIASLLATGGLLLAALRRRWRRAG